MSPRAITPDGSHEAWWGDRGTGKSYDARAAFLQAVRGYEIALAVYVTPNGEGTDPWPGPIVQPGADLTKAPRTVVYRGGSPRTYDGACLDVLRACHARRIRILFDEVHRVADYLRPGTPFAELMHEGRHRGIDVGTISQWPSMVTKYMQRAANVTHWFRLRSAEDLEWIRRRFGVEAGRQLWHLPLYRSIVVPRDEPPAGWEWRYVAEEKKLARKSDGASRFSERSDSDRKKPLNPRPRRP